MIESKKINLIILIAMIFALVLSTALFVLGNSVDLSMYQSEPSYVTEIFGSDIISIEIVADEDDWQEMLDNAISEQFIMADVIVNGRRFKNVGIRPKGNSSLTQVASSDSDRYSFRLQFDEYIKDQTCFGLKSFVINNIHSDTTYMKEYVSYELMKEAGVDTPYFGFADIKVNGEPWGFYLAIELYNESYEQRVYGDALGMMYNVKSMDMTGRDDDGGATSNAPGVVRNPQDDTLEGPPDNRLSDNRSDANEPRNDAPSSPSDKMTNIDEQRMDSSTQENSMPQFPGQNNRQGENRRQGGMMGGGSPGGSSGGSLEYIDDNSDSYSAIFGNVVGKGSEDDYQRVIEALKALSQNRDIEEYFEVDQILRYLAAHTIVVNLDSYSSNMAQNYYIYENNGKITILPWDYNLSWGGFQSGDASAVVNFPIDTPVSGVDMLSRPLLEKLFSNNEYLEKYHKYLQELIDAYFADGKFEAKIKELDVLIGEYVKNDASSFYTYEEYEKSISAFISLGNLRAESVQGQLDGRVPSTTLEQQANPEQVIDIGDFTLQELGGMGGGNRGGFPGGENNEDMRIMAEAMDVIQSAKGEITDEVKTKLSELGMTDEQIEQLPIMNIPNGNMSMEERHRQMRQPMEFDDVNMTSRTSNTDYIVWVGISIIVLIVAIVITARLRRNY